MYNLIQNLIQNGCKIQFDGNKVIVTKDGSMMEFVNSSELQLMIELQEFYETCIK